MKIRSVAALFGLAINFALPTFSQQKTPKELIVGTWLSEPWGDGPSTRSDQPRNRTTASYKPQSANYDSLLALDKLRRAQRVYAVSR
jgi:hypothetical protein